MSASVNACRKCMGTGRNRRGGPCKNCRGTGRVNSVLGGLDALIGVIGGLIKLGFVLLVVVVVIVALINGH